MTFQDSIKVCFNKYVDFSGRASRSEYWWFALFVVLGCIVTSMVNHWLYYLFALGTLLPQLAAASRRLHDTGRSGWWQLIGLIPLIGFIVLIVFLAQESGEATESTA
ncbi:uncharacterized membrane protein YhaH (DUF805 family) [Pelomonas saccharophila]|uniref:Uncharacterized membrane protein YhaH (DUF805 family) n=1 Tax=Roseateles saccharophilus TaxID=304 RepID=A0ABU1YQG2_ROSSA|nr:DUF805 domain-containing protein [Roseateles saccharophilus]MDR7271103.1 uncharacterized membrane protein YhaH (DUF805 family) [Roseateles saccharophilus]